MMHLVARFVPGTRLIDSGCLACCSEGRRRRLSLYGAATGPGEYIATTDFLSLYGAREVRFVARLARATLKNEGSLSLNGARGSCRRALATPRRRRGTAPPAPLRPEWCDTSAGASPGS